MRGRPATLPFVADPPALAEAGCPAWLDAAAKAKWRELVAAADLGIPDADLLAAYCLAFSRWRAEAALANKTGGDIKRGKNGDYFNPHAIARDRAERSLMRLHKALNLDKRAR